MNRSVEKIGDVDKRTPAFTVRIPQAVRIPAKNRCNELGVSLGAIIIEFLEDWGAGRAKMYPKPRVEQSSGRG